MKEEEEADRRLRGADERPFIPPRQRPSFPSFWPDFRAASPRSRWGEGKVDSQPTETRGWHGMVCSLQVERRRVERGGQLRWLIARHGALSHGRQSRAMGGLGGSHWSRELDRSMQSPCTASSSVGELW